MTDIEYLRSIYLNEQEDMEFLRSINLNEELYSLTPTKPISKEQQPYKPYGKAMKDLFYFKGPILGLSGPAGTGKSRAELEKLHLCMEKYPGARGFIARKTRESLSESALFTFEEKVVPVGHPILTGVSRRYRQDYIYPNGSQIVVVGLDKPQKVMSTEFDMGYVQEFIECELNDLEMLMTRLRNGVIPYNQLIFDCNPDKPEHWIYQSSLSGKFVLLDTFHEDNPVLWQYDDNGTEVAYDGRPGNWTEKGKAYIEKLDALTGSNKLRLRFGKWASSEGVVYPEWSANPTGEHPGHVINRFEVPQEWRRIWVVDFGVNHPFVWHCYAIDHDGRMYCEHEIYMTNRLVQDHAKQMLAVCGWERTSDGEYRAIRENPLPFPSDCYGDWDKEGLLTLERETGFRWTNAYKSINDGIQEVSARLRCSIDGKPRIQFFRDCLVEEDPVLKDKMLPMSAIQEFNGYVWDTKNGRRKGEIPVDKDNHGMDVVRYACSGEAGLKDKYNAKDVPMESMPLARVVAIPNRTRNDSGERLNLNELNEYVALDGHKSIDSRKNIPHTNRSQRQQLIGTRSRRKRNGD